jgi:hypothetical protein
MARNFTSSGDVISFTPTPIINVPLSISAWVNPVATGTTRAIFGGFGTNIGCLEFRLEIAGNVYLIKQGVAAILLSTGAVSNGVWSQVAATDSGTAQAVYIGGGTPTTGSTTSSYNTVTTYNIGQAFQGATEQWAGLIADIALWSVVLTAGEVKALADGVRPYNIRPKSIIAYWPLDGLQSPEPELSGNAFNGTLTGTAFAPGPPVTMFTPKWPRNMDAPVTLRQKHFRFRTDTGAADATPTWGAAEDTN